jgi:hypothetical protein
MLVQFRRVFVSAAGKGVKVVCLHTLLDVWQGKDLEEGAIDE